MCVRTRKERLPTGTLHCLRLSIAPLLWTNGRPRQVSEPHARHLNVQTMSSESIKQLWETSCVLLYFFSRLLEVDGIQSLSKSNWGIMIILILCGHCNYAKWNNTYHDPFLCTVWTKMVANGAKQKLDVWINSVCLTYCLLYRCALKKSH